MSSFKRDFLSLHNSLLMKDSWSNAQLLHINCYYRFQSAPAKSAPARFLFSAPCLCSSTAGTLLPAAALSICSHLWPALHKLRRSALLLITPFTISLLFTNPTITTLRVQTTWNPTMKIADSPANFRNFYGGDSKAECKEAIIQGLKAVNLLCNRIK
jgi:hypothetical protein